MSIHRSLKTKSGALNQHRNVLTRAERITRLTAEERWDATSQSALGIIKVRSIKAKAGKKPKKAGVEGAEGAAAVAPAAAGAKPAAAGAKPAAGAGKTAAAAPAAKKK
ncbi:MAG: small basic protein [Phycisphaerales bacterium]|nr:small basic protein [Phycisphaerales bacterium]